MRLIDLVSEQSIRTDLRGHTAPDVVRELVDVLAETERLGPASPDDVLQAVLTRERAQSTGLGAGVAIPHALCHDLPQPVASLGLHPQGVDFHAIDHAPVHLVVLILVPPNHFQTHIRALAGVARLLNDPSLRRTLLQSPSPSSLWSTLRTLEE